MSSQETSVHIKAAIIGGIFVVIVSCIGAAALIINTLVSNGFIIIGPSVRAGNPNPQPTATSKVVDVAATLVPAISISRPSQINIVIGEHQSIPPGDWTWICTGDFSITLTDGTKKALYDAGVSNTGLTLILQPNSSFTLDGPFDMAQGIAVGDCYPYAQDEKDSAISGAMNAQFDKGCGSKCQYVNVIELDKDGSEVNNYWLPQKP